MLKKLAKNFHNTLRYSRLVQLPGTIMAHICNESSLGSRGQTIQHALSMLF